MENLLKTLNEKQKEAVKNTEGPVLILAGPGSGKTKTITHRIAYLITKGVSPQNILAVTFTNKAASEMKERIINLLKTNLGENSDIQLPWVGTFHSICVKILRENAPLLGYTPKFVIYDDADQLSLIKKVLKELKINPKEISPQKVRGIISNAKSELKTPELYEEEADNPFKKRVAEIYHLYQEKLKESDALDFDDLIMQAVFLLRENKKVLAKYQKRFQYILVDEYQDTNQPQNEWVNMLARENKNICVVGDDAQAIYGWRNARVENILNFQDIWPGAQKIKLDKNYRSTQTIINAASHLIKNNQSGYEKNLWTHNPKGGALKIKELPSEYDEAEFILNEVQNLIEAKAGEHNENSGEYNLNDFVVLYRTNAQSRAIEETFLRNNIPYKIVGGVRFYQRKEVKDLTAFLRLIQNPGDTTALERLSDLKLGKLKEKIDANPNTKNEALSILAKDFQNKAQNQNLSLQELIKYIVNKTNFEKILRDDTEKGEERWQNVQEVLSVAENYKTMPLNESIEQFLEDVTLMQEADTVNYENELVHLMTLHMAKGLEFPVVFIAGCEEGILPHSNSMMDRQRLEEERRLAYVGLTRAQEKAYLLFARRRTVWGSIQSNPPSSFLAEIPEEYTEFEPIEEETEWSGDLLDDDGDDFIQWN